MAYTLRSLVRTVVSRGRPAEAEGLVQELQMIQSQKPADDSFNLVLPGLRAEIAAARGDLAAAEMLTREALALRRKCWGDTSRWVAASLLQLSRIRQARGDRIEAEALIREALTIQRTLYGEDSGGAAAALLDLGKILQARGDFAGAEVVLSEALEIRKKLAGDGDRSVAYVQGILDAVRRQRSGSGPRAATLPERAPGGR